MKKVLPFLVLAVLLAAVVASWFLLPDPVLVQFSPDGVTLPKVLTLGVSAAISVLGAVQAAGSEDREHRGGYAMMLIAAVLLALVLFVNR